MDLNKEIVKAGDLLFEPYLTEEEILTRVAQMGKTLTEVYKGKDPIFLVVLNGAFIFAADLLRNIDFHCETSFVKLKSYDGLTSTGKSETLLGLELDVTDRHIIVIEDIIDTGNTLFQFVKELRMLKPKSVSLASLLFKKEAFNYDYPIDYIGFTIPDRFVIGYGLDYNDLGRNLKSIYQLKS